MLRLTSPTPFSAHHSANVPRSISPRTRNSNGMGLGSDSALFTSCESWYRFHDVGMRNFWDGSG